jgi:hypothetical protein
MIARILIVEDEAGDKIGVRLLFTQFRQWRIQAIDSKNLGK